MRKCVRSWCPLTSLEVMRGAPGDLAWTLGSMSQLGTSPRMPQWCDSRPTLPPSFCGMAQISSHLGLSPHCPGYSSAPHFGMYFLVLGRKEEVKATFSLYLLGEGEKHRGRLAHDHGSRRNR